MNVVVITECVTNIVDFNTFFSVCFILPIFPLFFSSFIDVFVPLPFLEV